MRINPQNSTQSFHFWKKLQMVASNPRKIHEIFNQFLFKVSVFKKKKNLVNTKYLVAAYIDFGVSNAIDEFSFLGCKLVFEPA